MLTEAAAVGNADGMLTVCGGRWDSWCGETFHRMLGGEPEDSDIFPRPRLAVPTSLETGDAETPETDAERRERMTDKDAFMPWANRVLTEIETDPLNQVAIPLGKLLTPPDSRLKQCEGYCFYHEKAGKMELLADVRKTCVVFPSGATVSQSALLQSPPQSLTEAERSAFSCIRDSLHESLFPAGITRLNDSGDAAGISRLNDFGEVPSKWGMWGSVTDDGEPPAVLPGFRVAHRDESFLRTEDRLREWDAARLCCHKLLKFLWKIHGFDANDDHLQRFVESRLLWELVPLLSYIADM